MWLYGMGDRFASCPLDRADSLSQVHFESPTADPSVSVRWDQGLLDMCVGEKRKLTIAPHLAYGDRAMGPIPAGSTLVFTTELMGIAGVGKDEL